MAAGRPAPLRLLVLALAWLVPSLALWYAASGPLAGLQSAVAGPFIGLSGVEVSARSVRGNTVVFDLAVQPPYEQQRRGAQAAVATVELAAGKYSFGIALFLALSLASPLSRRPAPVAIGLAVLAVLPAWGIAFETLKQLMLAPVVGDFVAAGPGARSAIAFGYQVGALILPTLAPVAAWLALNPGAWGAGRERPA